VEAGPELQSDEMLRWRHIQTRAKTYLGDRREIKARHGIATNAPSGTKRKPAIVENAALSSSSVPQPPACQ